jgi:hypothetical protein
MAVRGNKLTPKQHQSILALLETTTVKEAAEKVGVSDRSLRRWLLEPDFLADYRSARQQVVEHCVSLLQQCSAAAVTVLVKNMTCGKPAVEIRAAAIIINGSVKGVETLDIETRLRAIERRDKLARRIKG